MFNAGGRDLRRNHREAGTGTGKGADIFRIKHRFRLNFIFFAVINSSDWIWPMSIPR